MIRRCGRRLMVVVLGVLTLSSVLLGIDRAGANVVVVPIQPLHQLPAGVEDRVSGTRPVARSRYVRIDVPALTAAIDQARATGAVVEFPLFCDLTVGFVTKDFSQSPADVGGANAWVGRMDGDDVATAIVVVMPDGSMIARFTVAGRSFAIDQLAGDVFIVRELLAQAISEGPPPASQPNPPLPLPWALSAANAGGGILHLFGLGVVGDQPLACDWNGDGTDTYGTYHDGVWTITDDPAVVVARSFAWGAPGDRAVCGDWNNDGADTIGVFRPSTAVWYFANSNGSGGVDGSFQWGLPSTNPAGGDFPLVGDWDGDGADSMGVRRGDTFYLSNVLASSPATAIPWGWAVDKPVTGDWDGNGTDTIGVMRSDGDAARWMLSNDNATVHLDFPWGTATQTPLAGDWCITGVCVAPDGIDTPALVGY